MSDVFFSSEKPWIDEWKSSSREKLWNDLDKETSKFKSIHYPLDKSIKRGLNFNWRVECVLIIQLIESTFHERIVKADFKYRRNIMKIISAVYIFYKSDRCFEVDVKTLISLGEDENSDYSIIMCKKVVNYAVDYHFNGAKINDLIGQFMAEHNNLSDEQKKLMDFQVRQIIDLYGLLFGYNRKPIVS